MSSAISVTDVDDRKRVVGELKSLPYVERIRYHSDNEVIEVQLSTSDYSPKFLKMVSDFGFSMKPAGNRVVYLRKPDTGFVITFTVDLWAALIREYDHYQEMSTVEKFKRAQKAVEQGLADDVESALEDVEGLNNVIGILIKPMDDEMLDSFREYADREDVTIDALGELEDHISCPDLPNGEKGVAVAENPDGSNPLRGPKVYFIEDSETYHTHKDCSSFARSSRPQEGRLKDVEGSRDKCKLCHKRDE